MTTDPTTEEATAPPFSVITALSTWKPPADPQGQLTITFLRDQADYTRYDWKERAYYASRPDSFPCWVTTVFTGDEENEYRYLYPCDVARMFNEASYAPFMPPLDAPLSIGQFLVGKEDPQNPKEPPFWGRRQDGRVFVRCACGLPFTLTHHYVTAEGNVINDNRDGDDKLTHGNPMRCHRAVLVRLDGWKTDPDGAAYVAG